MQCKPAKYSFVSSSSAQNIACILPGARRRSSDHEHQRVRRRRARHPHRRRRPSPRNIRRHRQGSGRRGASSTRRGRRPRRCGPRRSSCHCHGATQVRWHYSVLPAARPRQPVRGAYRLLAEDRGLRARSRRRHRHGHGRRDALCLHPVFPVPRPLRRVPGIGVLHGGERDRGGLPGAVPPLLRHPRPAPTGHRLTPSPARRRHDNGGNAGGGSGGRRGYRGAGALGEPAGQLGAHLHAVPRLLPAHQRLSRRLLPLRPHLHAARHLGRLQHQETLNDYTLVSPRLISASIYNTRV